MDPTLASMAQLTTWAEQHFQTITGFSGWNLHVFVVGVSIAATCSLLSPYIVLRRMAMISEGISHAGFGGLGIALFAAMFIPALAGPAPERLITGFFCLLTALLIGYFSRSGKVSEDSAIGIFLVASVALGDLLIRMRSLFISKPMPGNIEQLLFGDFVAVNAIDGLLSLACALVCFTLIAFLYHQFLYTTLDEEMARVNGVNTRLINVLLLVMVTLVIVIGVRMVGFLMITAMTIIPGATANMLSRRFGRVLTSSLAIGTIVSFVVLVVVFSPWVQDVTKKVFRQPLSILPPGPILVLTLFAIFVLVWLWRHLRKPRVTHSH